MKRLSLAKRLKFNPWLLVLLLVPIIALGLYFIRSGHAVSADINGDGKVDILDLSILAAHYGQSGSFAQGDINGDGKINIFDLSILAANWGATSGGGSACAQTAKTVTGKTSLASYADMGGDQVVVVPNGTKLTGGTTTTAHPTTSGACKGWLIVMAQSPGGVTVDLSGGQFWTKRQDAPSPTSSHVMFIGFKFINGTVFNQGQGDTFWYDDISMTSVDNSHFLTVKDQSISGRWLGTNIHNACFGAKVDHEHLESANLPVLFQGVYIYDIGQKGVSMNTCHTDGVANVGGGEIDGITFDHDYINGQVILEDYASTAAPDFGCTAAEKASGVCTSGGPIKNANFTNVWVTNSVTIPFDFATWWDWANVDDVAGSRSNVTMFNNSNNGSAGRINSIDSVQTYGSVNTPGRINVADSGLSFSTPTDTSLNASPAGQWRSQNPYNNWANFLY